MIATIFAAAAAASPFSIAPIAPIVVRSFRVDVASTDAPRERRFVAPAGRTRVRVFGIDRGIQVSIPDATYSQFVTYPASLDRRRFIAAPDGGADESAPGQPFTDYVVAEARAGRLTLTSVKLGGRAALRGEFAVTANDCAGLRAGRARVWLSSRTLLPLRTEERRVGRRVHVKQYAYGLVNATLPDSLFVIPRSPSAGDVVDYGFVRTSPALAAGPLPYVPRLPTALPVGFVLGASGWAPRSAVTGAEGSNPPDRWLFGAVYARGQERISVTQRVAAPKSWPGGDPFGRECGQIRTERASVNGIAAEYGIGPSIPSHLTWRDGALLYTVSGPFPQTDLEAIASSLTKIGRDHT